MKYIFITRHGKTLWNTEKRAQGRKDSPLTQEGIEQTKHLSNFLNIVEFDATYTSPLKRAVDSANILVGHRNIPIIEEERIIEMSLGIWEGLTEEDRKKINFQKEMKFKQLSDEFYDGGMEKLSDVTKRTSNFIEDVVKTDFNKILIVCHSITLRSILMLWDDRTIETFWNGHRPRPGSLTVVGFPKDSKDYKDGEIILPPNIFDF